VEKPRRAARPTPSCGKQRFVQNNKPHDNVSWFDAVAFCRWMTARLRSLDDIDETGVFKDVLDKIKNEGWEVRLPTEWEWQMAATAAEPDNLFPWGLDWEDRHVHTKHNQLNQSMPVDMYLEGA
jgi:formylglycine-generating enzyme required for sulfatase activity